MVVRRQLRRDAVESFFRDLPPCLVGREACATAHHWAQRLLAFGHRVRLIPPTRVKAYVLHGKKNDATDAAAIAEAVTRPHMAFVPVKGEEQQAVLMLHRTRDLLVRQRTMLINGLRAHLAEFGIVAAQGRRKVSALIAGLDSRDIPELARAALQELAGQIETCDQRIAAIEQQIVRWHKNNEASRRLATIPGIGPITASVLSATVTDPSAFKSGRHLAAWLGLVPRQNNRCEVPHQPTRRRERHMKRFKSARHAQRFLSTHSVIHNHFQLRRHLLSATEYRAARARAFTGWREAAGFAQVA